MILTSPQTCALRPDNTKSTIHPRLEPTRDHVKWFADPICQTFVALYRLFSCLCFDLFGSGIRGHNLRSVPDLPHGIRPSRRGPRCVCGSSRRVTARYGLRACRIGEAQHPGPALVTSKCQTTGSQPTRANRVTSAPAGEPGTRTATVQLAGIDMLQLPIAYGNNGSSHSELAAPVHHFRQGGDLVTGATWNTFTTPAPGDAITKAPAVAVRDRIDDPEASADEPMTPGCDNDLVTATGPAPPMVPMPPPPAPIARIKAEKTPVAFFPCFICDQTLQIKQDLCSFMRAECMPASRSSLLHAPGLLPSNAASAVPKDVVRFGNTARNIVAGAEHKSL